MYCRKFLYCAKPPKPNLSKDEALAIKRLNDNPHIIILKVDKGNSMVIMNTKDYESNPLDILSFSSYKILPKYPINSTTQCVTKAINSSSIDATI